MAQVLAFSDARRDRDGKVDAGSDHAVHLLGCGEPVDRGLVLDGHDRPPVRVREAERRGIAVDGDDVKAARLRRLEQPDLPRTRP